MEFESVREVGNARLVEVIQGQIRDLQSVGAGSCTVQRRNCKYRLIKSKTFSAGKMERD
jgi:hypothetical protein